MPVSPLWHPRPVLPDRLQYEHEANTRRPRRHPHLTTPAAPQPPIAAKKPHPVVSANGTRADEYYWLRDDTRENPEMLAYVNAENAYADAMLAHIKPLEEKLYKEIVGRLKQDDSTVPYLMNGYWYYKRFETGGEYPIYARRKGSQGRARRNPAERQRDGEGPRLLRNRRDGRQPRQQTAGVRGR